MAPPRFGASADTRPAGEPSLLFKIKSVILRGPALCAAGQQQALFVSPRAILRSTTLPHCRDGRGSTDEAFTCDAYSHALCNVPTAKRAAKQMLDGSVENTGHQ